MLHILRFLQHIHLAAIYQRRSSALHSELKRATILSFHGLINVSKAPLILLPAAKRLYVLS